MNEDEYKAIESNEDLVAAQPNAAYGTAGDRTVHGQVQESGGSTATEKQLLEEGHVYDNEDLVVAQSNTAYDTAGQLVDSFFVL